MSFQYQIKVNGVLADTKPTEKGAKALITERFHGRKDVSIERNGVVIWRAAEAL